MGQQKPRQICLVFLFSWAVLAIGGCADPQPAGNARSVDEVLKQMLAAYRGATSYEDQGTIQIRYRTRQGEQLDRAAYSVKFQRPNQIRIDAYQVTIACDGDTLQARVSDEPSADLDGQMIVCDAPPAITPDALRFDQVLSSYLEGGAGGEPIQIGLLLDDAPFEELFAESDSRTLMVPAQLGDRQCDRVRIDSPGGSFVFWIDQQQNSLRRLEYPMGDVNVTAEFAGATLNQPVDTAAFTLDRSPHARLVQQLVVPPQPLPTNLYGEQAAPFELEPSDGGTVSTEALRGKLAVLVWFNRFDVCQQTLRQVQSVYDSFKSNGNVRFYAVWAEGNNISDTALSELLNRWSVTLSVVRDNQAQGQQVFNIPGAPTIIVLDSDSRLQMFGVGWNPDLERQLSRILERLGEGEDVATQLVQQHRTEVAAYEQAVTAATIEN